MSFFTVKRGLQKSKGFKLVVSKAVTKKAVERNLLKRRIRAVLRPVIGAAEPGFVIIVRPGAAGLDFEGIKQELLKTLHVKK